MKRSEDSRIIKIPDPSSVQSMNSSPSAAIAVVQKNPNVPTTPTSASIAPVFPQRPSVIEIPGQPVQAHRGGVTVYREPAATVISSAVPPAAHSGIVVTATPSSGLVQPPSAVLHGPPQSVTAIKPDAISKCFYCILLHHFMTYYIIETYV